MAENAPKSNTPIVLTGILVVIFLALILTRDQWAADGISGTIGKRKSVEKQQFKEGDVALSENDARLSRLMQNKTFKNLVTSGEFASLIANADFNNLISDPRFQSLMADPAFAAIINSQGFQALDVDEAILILDGDSETSSENYGDMVGVSIEDQTIGGSGGGSGVGTSNRSAGAEAMTSRSMTAAVSSGGGSDISQGSSISGDADNASVLSGLNELKSLFAMPEFSALYKYKRDNKPRSPGDPLQGVIISLYRSHEFRSLLMSPKFRAALSLPDFKNILSAGEFHSMMLNSEFRSLAGMPMDK